MLGELSSEAGELGVAADEVGLGVDLDEHAHGRVSRDERGDGALVGRATGLLGERSQTAGAQDVDSGVQVAVGLGERLLALHHAGSGALAELLDHAGGDVSHRWYLPEYRIRFGSDHTPAAVGAEAHDVDYSAAGASAAAPRSTAGSLVSTQTSAAGSATTVSTTTSATGSATSLFDDRDRSRLTTTGTAASLGDDLRDVGLRDVPAATLDDGVGDDAAHERDRADGVVVGRDDVVDVIGIGVGVDQADDRDVQTLGLADRDVLALGVDDEDRTRKRRHVAHAVEVGLAACRAPS